MSEPTWGAVKVVFSNESFWYRLKMWAVAKAIFQLMPDVKDDELTENGRRLRELSKPNKVGQ